MVLVYIIIALLVFLVGWGLYLTFGPGGEGVRDPIDEHSKMHELGIAHSHKEGTYRLIAENEHKFDKEKSSS